MRAMANGLTCQATSTCNMTFGNSHGPDTLAAWHHGTEWEITHTPSKDSPTEYTIYP